jgi:hypothetical protein
MPERLRILRVPEGAAPEHVRRAWVGLELPLLDQRDFIVQSVLETGRMRSRWEMWWWRLTGRARRQRGYAVLVLDALAVLETERPLEAAWWRQNAAHLCRPGALFVFDAGCGERAPEVRVGPHGVR